MTIPRNTDHITEMDRWQDLETRAEQWNDMEVRRETAETWEKRAEDEPKSLTEEALDDLLQDDDEYDPGDGLDFDPYAGQQLPDDPPEPFESDLMDEY